MSRASLIPLLRRERERVLLKTCLKNIRVNNVKTCIKKHSVHKYEQFFGGTEIENRLTLLRK